MKEQNFSTLFKVLSSEQQILQRTDQKAFTMLSILGVFMVFFIVHFLKVQLDWFKFVMVIIYFIAALIAIVNLILVIVPRIRKDKPHSGTEGMSPMFFGGISQYQSAEAYAEDLMRVGDDAKQTYKMFAAQVYSLGQINNYKNLALKRAILFFVVAILSELLIIMSMAWARALPYLFPAS
jgi:hypothetical protein|tara:strand:+ start:3028 stop:3567 length:540 start_codon:yes stop_codon:yes gene_type:complete